MGCTLTVIGLQHGVIVVGTRNNDSEMQQGSCSTRHRIRTGATWSDALLARPVPLGRDMQVSDDLFMDLDAPPLKRTRDTPSGTQPSDFTNPNEFAQRAQTASIPLTRTPEPVVPAPETPFQPWPHGKGCLAATNPYLRRPFQSFLKERRLP